MKLKSDVIRPETAVHRVTYFHMTVCVFVAESFLTSALDGGEWSPTLSGRFTPRYPLDRRVSGLQSQSGRCRFYLKTSKTLRTFGDIVGKIIRLLAV
jgi:hypothetical protein